MPLAARRPSQPDTVAPQVEATLLRARLANLIQQHAAPDCVVASPVPRLTLGHAAQVLHPVHMVYQPALCVIAQGSKQVLLGPEALVYDHSQALIFAHHLPVTGHVLGPTPQTPHLAVRLDLDVQELAELALAMKLGPPVGQACARGVYTTPLTPELLHPLIRLVQLIDQPQDIATLAPLANREILYRLLNGPGGARLAQLAMPGSQSQRVAVVISMLQQRFRETLRIEQLARSVHWSSSALHHHFKAVTAMTPLQFQKQLRLQEARRILLSENLDASTAGHRVGYDSPSQFNREYSRFFGAPPARDLQRLRAMLMSR